MIIGSQPSNKGAVGCYRIIQPHHKLHTADNDIHAAILHSNINQAQFEALSPQIDVWVYQYPQLKSQLEHIKFMASDPNTLTVVELDDDIWNIDARQENYHQFGTREVKVNDVWLFKDGVNGFDLQKNQERMGILADCVAACDLVTVTTPHLKEVIEKNLKSVKSKTRVAVLPNCLDLQYWDPVEIVKDEIRIMWQGGHGHRHDLATIVKPLQEVLKKHPEVKVVLAGNSWPEIEKALGKERLIINRAWTSFDAHPYRLKLLGADIAVCPLEDVSFNHAKSELKYTEASALGIPSVCTDMVPYSPVIKDGKTGFLAKTEDEWVAKLSQLIEDETLRKKVGSAARAWVEKERNADLTYPLWADTYKAHLETKKILQ